MPNEADKELDEILRPFATQTDDKSVTLVWGTKDQIAEAKAQLLSWRDRAVRAGRDEGFVASKAAMSFNANCNNCHANQLTIDYLCQPYLAAETKGES